MKNLIKISVFIFFFSTFTVKGQEKDKDITYSKLEKMPNNKPKGWKPLPKTQFVNYELEFNQEKSISEIPSDFNPNIVAPCPSCNPTVETITKGTNFIGNNLSGGVPADNFIAISNSGKIISVDNYSIQEFNTSGVQQSINTWSFFFTDATLLYNNFYDPKIIYDSYSDRFILIILYNNPNNFSDSRILMGYSNAITTSPITWNFFQIRSIIHYTNPANAYYWFDYPNIAINNNEVFITSNVYREPRLVPDTAANTRSALFELNKAAGYANLNPQVKAFTNVQDSQGNSAYSLFPLSDGLQDINYVNKMYLVNNSLTLPHKVFSYNLTGDANTIGNNIVITTSNSPITQNKAAYANQSGSLIGDRIRVSDNKIRGGYHKNGKLHFVFERSDQGWSEIAYFKFNTVNSTLTYSTYGGFEFLKNHMYPSIACMSADGEKSILTYALTGPTIFNQIWAIDNQSSVWGSPKIIKQGVGLLSQVTYNVSATDPTKTYERIGDYTNIQRKYNSDTAWLVGSYPFGTTPNIHGSISGLNAWISEVFLAPSTFTNKQNNFIIFPNPNTTNLINITLEQEFADEYCELIIKDFTGNQIFKTKLFNGENFNINIPSLAKGIYVVSINSKTNFYENQKLIIN